VLGSLSICGCANFIDDVTSVPHEGGFFARARHRFQVVFNPPDPLEVLAHSSDNDLRARALRKLPDKMEKQEAIHMLSAVAQDDKEHRLCRLAAVETLSGYDDPQVGEALLTAFYAPANSRNDHPQAAIVRIAVIEALGKVSQPTAIKDPRTGKDVIATLSEAVARDPIRDVRMAAARSLANFRDHRATQALVAVIREEEQKPGLTQDVALRREANLALQEITGQDLKAESTAWEQYLRQSPAPDSRLATGERTGNVPNFVVTPGSL
jgi:HEAT repeat protein